MKINLKQNIINFFIPPKCPFCGKIITEGSICKVCKEDVDKLKLVVPSTEKYARVGSFKFVDKCVSCYDYTGQVRRGIINAKFKECRMFVNNFIEYIPFDLRQFMAENNVDIIISVPYHKSKLYNREYDLPQEMAKKIEKFTNIEYNNNLIKKIKRTANQHSLTQKERQENLKGVFAVTQDLQGKNILIIDDVTTTGSTLEQVAKALKQANADKVLALTFAWDK